LKKETVSPVVEKEKPAVLPEPMSDEQWVKSLNRLQKKEAIDSCLDEYDATLEIIGKHKKVNPDQLKVARSWCVKHKHILRLLGYRKRLPLIEDKNSKSSSNSSENIFA